MNRLALALLAGAVLGVIPARATSVPISRVIDLMGSAQKRVLVYVPYLTDTTFADALRAAKVDRTRSGLQVIVVTVPFFAAKEDALTNALALAGLPIVEAQVPSTTSYVLVDDYLFSSAQIGRVGGAQDVRLMQPGDTNTFLKWFKGAAQAGRLVTAFEAYRRTQRR